MFSNSVHCQYILNIQEYAHNVIRSPSGDTDIIIISVSLLNSDHIDKMKINEQEKEALIGFHAITGNDYVSSFFGKGK